MNKKNLIIITLLASTIVFAWCSTSKQSMQGNDMKSSTMHDMNNMTGMSCTGQNCMNNCSSGNCMQNCMNWNCGQNCCSWVNSMSGSMWMMMHSVSSEEEFVVNMIPHHQEAVDSSNVILTKSRNPQIRKLAEDIIKAQAQEISMMEGRVKSRYPNSSIKSSYMKMMPDMTNLNESEADKAYLAWMIAHHQWAIQMAENVMKVKHRMEVMSLANNIITTQNNEITMMQDLLKSLPSN